MAPSLNSLLLFTYITFETIRANYAYHVFTTFPAINPSLIVLISEILKLLIAVLVLLRSGTGFARSETGLAGLWAVSQCKQSKQSKSNILRSAVPAGLYLINSLIYLTVLPLVSPSLLAVCILAKLPATGILHHVMIRKQRNVWGWWSLLFICIGVVLFNIPKSTTAGAVNGNDGEANWYIAPLAGGVIAMLSALASIFSETLTKSGGFWESQAWLYFWGIVFATASYPISTKFYGMTKEADNFQGEMLQWRTLLGPASMLTAVTAGVGLIVAVLLRMRDNLLKLVGTSATIVTIAATQYLLIPKLREGSLTPWKVFGGGLVTVATWCYNYYQHRPADGSSELVYARLQEAVRSSEIVNLEGRGESVMEMGRISSETLVSPDHFEDVVEYIAPKVQPATYLDPNATSVLCLMLVVTFLTVETSYLPD
jgi:UDP-sugar transporter A1/2/3